MASLGAGDMVTRGESLLLFWTTPVWFSALTSDGSVWPVTPAPKDLTSSSGFHGHLHTCYLHPHVTCTHTHAQTHKIKIIF